MRVTFSSNVLLFVAVYALLCAGLSFAHTENHILSEINVSRVRLDTSLAAAGTQISVSKTLISNGESVQVHYSLPDPSPLDWIGVYSPADVDESKSSPIKYQWAKKDPNFLSTGEGVLTFDIFNMRADYRVTLFRNGLKEPVKVAHSQVINFKYPDEPLNPRLVVTSNPTEMRLMWSSRSSFEPFASYGENALTSRIKADTIRYTRTDMCGPPATAEGYRDAGPIHTVVLTGLEPGRTYKYQFGDGDNLSKEYSFKQPPAPNQPVYILAYGDMGQATTDDSLQHWPQQLPSINTTKHMTREMESGVVDAVFHIGDISYARGYASEWDVFLNQITPLAAHAPYMVCLGNHEMDSDQNCPLCLFNGTDSGGECGVAMMHQFLNPRKSFSQPWYSFNIGGVHAVFMSTEHAFDTGSEQLAFIAADLAAVDRSKTPWVIFSGHRPMYIDSTNFKKPAGDQPVAAELRKYVEPFLMKYKVDIALWGHHHSYQRGCAVYQEKCLRRSNANRVFTGPYAAPIQMVIGMAGQSLSTNIMDQQPEYMEFVDVREYGYGRIQAFNSTTLHFEFLSNALDGKVRDDFWIVRTN